jgi:hypothetical protein
VRIGSPLQDAANPNVDSYEEAIRNSEHVGTMTQDGATTIHFQEKE